MFNQFGAYDIELYDGEKRAGKTLCMVADTHEDLKRTQAKDVMIFTNFNLKESFFKGLAIDSSNWQKIERIDLALYHHRKLEFKSCIFLIDELQIWLDNRNFAKAEKVKIKELNEETGIEEEKEIKINYNSAVVYFFGQMGKRGNVLRGTVHDYSMIDFKARIYTGKLNFVFKGLVNEKGIWKPILNNNRELSLDENSRLYIQKEEVIKKQIKTNFLPEFRYLKSKPKYIKASDYFDMYDTEELI